MLGDTLEDKPVDLDKLRDEKCIPVARGVLIDMAAELMPTTGVSRAELQPVIMKILQRSLDADLNVLQENPFVFQLILGVLSGLSTTVQSCNTVAIDDARYGAIGKRILGIVATADIPMGKTLTPEEIETHFAAVKEQLNALFTEEKLSWLEVKYIMDSIFGAFKVTQQIFSENVEMSTHRMEAKLLGIGSMDELTMKTLDKALITPVSTAVDA